LPVFESKETIRCPRCGSCNVVGAPNALAGSKRATEYKWFCANCGAFFGNLDDDSKYEKITREISLEIKGFFKDKFTFHAQSSEDGMSYQVASSNKNINYNGIASQEDWTRLSNALFSQCFIKDWKSVYYSSDLVDGTSWSLEIKLKRKHAIQFCGCNGFPPYWNRLLDVLRAFAIVAGISLDEFRTE